MFEQGSIGGGASKVGLAYDTVKNSLFVDNNQRSLATKIERTKTSGIIGELISTADIRLDELGVVDYSEQFALLTPREIEMLVGVTSPHNLDRDYNELAEQFLISVRTLRNHLNNINTKLSTNSRIELMQVSLGLPLVDQQDDIIDE